MFRLAHLHLLELEVHDTLVSVVGGRWVLSTLPHALGSNADTFEQAIEVGQATRFASCKASPSC
jgi:hypothetical protein